MTYLFNLAQIRKLLIVVFFLFESSILTYGQQIQTQQHSLNSWELGLNIGLLGYFGDVSTPKDISSQMSNSIDVGYSLSLSKQLSPLFGLKGSLLMGKLKGKNNSDLFFKSDLMEAMINATLNFSEICWGPNRNQLVNIYGLAGLGISNFNGSTTNTNSGTIIRTFGHNKGKGINGYELDGIGNIGLSVGLNLGGNIKAIIESTIKFTADDKLDGIINGFKYDAYNFTSFGVAYSFPLSHKQKSVDNAKNILPPLIKQSEPEKKVQPTIIVQEAKKTDTVAKPKVISKEIVKDGNSQASEEADSLANKIELMMSKAKKEALPIDRFKDEHGAKEVDKARRSGLSDNLDSYTGYKVQLFATQKRQDENLIKQKYPFATHIRIDKVNTLYHCSVGMFKTFKEANKFSLALHKKKGLQKTFVVYFKNGTRLGLIKK